MQCSNIFRLKRPASPSVLLIRNVEHHGKCWYCGLLWTVGHLNLVHVIKWYDENELFFAFNLRTNHQFHRSQRSPHFKIITLFQFLWETHLFLTAIQMSLWRTSFVSVPLFDETFPLREVISINEQTCCIHHKCYPLNILLVFVRANVFKLIKCQSFCICIANLSLLYCEC